MKGLFGFTVIMVALLLSGSAFAQELTFELNGKKYEAAKQDLNGYYIWADAKAACEGLVTPEDSHDDWFLPSKEELNAMYEQLQKKGVGNFADEEYWSSSEKNGHVAYSLFFDKGEPNEEFKGDGRSVRCIRAL
jgi:hypothetical protein